MSNQARMRVCLKCQQEFFSTGPGNRICKKCNRENLARYGYITESMLAAERGRKYWNGELMDDPEDVSGSGG
jgi:hypothetical protein